MADPTPAPVNRDRLMLTAMGDLTKSLQRLTEHMENADQAAVQRSKEATNAQSLATRSRVAAPNLAVAADRVAAAAGEKTAMDRLEELKQQRAAQPQNTNKGESLPPGASAGGGQPEEDPNGPSDAEALTFAMLGAHGGPFGRLRMQQYMLQRNIAWGASTARDLGQYFGNKGENMDAAFGSGAGAPWNAASSATNWVGQKLQWAQSPRGQWTAMGALSAYRLGGSLMRTTNDWREAGRRLGYGNQGAIGLFGHAVPWGQTAATEQGASLALERQALMGRLPGTGDFGGGLRKKDAEAAVGDLAAQGFSNQGGVRSLNPLTNMISGDNFNIAQNLMRPLMNMGLTAQDAAQWTPALRNAQESMQQLKDSLTALPAASKEAKQTIADLNAQLLQVGQTLVQQGGTLGKGAELGLGFQAATGMQPSIAGQLAQNPIYQGLMMGQYGVLPSGIADLPGGAQVQGMLSMFNLLKGATAGLNHDKYRTVDGVREKIASGQSLQDSQIAEMMGIDRSQVDRLRNQAQHGAAISNAFNVLGSSADKTGVFDPNLSPADGRKLWSREVDQKASALGLSQQQLKAIDSKGSLPDRFQELQKDLIGNHSNDASNQIQVDVKFTGAAAKWFEAQGKGKVKGLTLQANAGGQAPNNVVNTPYGDALAANGMMSVITPTTSGASPTTMVP